MSRQELIDEFWSKMPTADGIHGYSNMVERLLGYLTVEQIAEVVASLSSDEDDDEPKDVPCPSCGNLFMVVDLASGLRFCAGCGVRKE